MASRKRVHPRPDRAPYNPPRGTLDQPVDARLGALILPLRSFLGLTFIYAGLVKLLDPNFLNAAGPGSLTVQLQGFARDSPLAPLITSIGVPLAVPIGLLIAISELAVGIGALTGLAGRVAAWSGCAISVLFWLTASWPIKPFFYGPDLPYAAGWLTLALLGDGGRFVLSWRSVVGLLGRLSGTRSAVNEAWSPDRRAAIEVITVGSIALVTAGLALQRPRWLLDWLGAASAPGAVGSTADGAAPKRRPSRDRQPGRDRLDLGARRVWLIDVRRARNGRSRRPRQARVWVHRGLRCGLHPRRMPGSVRRPGPRIGMSMPRCRVRSGPARGGAGGTNEHAPR